MAAVVITRLTAAMMKAAAPATCDRAATLAGVLVLLSYSAFRMSMYGLETPLYLALFGACALRA